MEFTHRPTRVNAVRWTGENLAECQNLPGAHAWGEDLFTVDEHETLWVAQSPIVFPVTKGAWLVRRVDGWLLGMSHRRFTATFEAADELVPA